MKLRTILLGAGNSTRFGIENKLLLPYQGQALAVYSFWRLYKVLLALRKQLPELESSLEFVCQPGPLQAWWLSAERQQQEEALQREWGISAVPTLRLFLNEQAERGISSSLKLPLLETSGEKEVFLFSVCDQPKLKEESLLRFLLFCLEEGCQLACPASDQFWGNPCFFDDRFREDLLALEGDRGGKVVISRHLDLLRFFPLPFEELQDIDTPSELADLLSTSAAGLV